MQHAFRDSFIFTSDIVWFPGHMTKALNTVKKLCHNVDMMVEVRDARIPISSVNQEIEKSLRNKPRLILLHRCDLITKQQQLAELRYFQQRNERVLLTSVKTGTNMNAIIPSLLAVRQSRFTSVGSYFAVMGIPNVGKSSIIRSIQKSTTSFRKNSSPNVGAIPGVTKRVASTKVHVQPDVYMIDTPGIFLPEVKDPEVGMKLALCGSVKDSIVGEDEIADYLLFTLNHKGNFSYVEKVEGRAGLCASLYPHVS
ncbi:hypothetical protein WA577_005727 [Blastocystis sp. JDR]